MLHFISMVLSGLVVGRLVMVDWKVLLRNS